jgi:hypothetical protein
MRGTLGITANHVQAASVVDGDYDYVTIGVTWRGKLNLENPNECEKTQVMWSHDSRFGVVGSKVGDFIGCYGQGSANQEGIFTHRPIAELLIKTFTGLKYHELEWHENPLEKMLASGKPRLKKPKWLPEKPVDLVHLYSDVYVDVRSPRLVETDFFTAFRWDGKADGWKIDTKQTWFVCNDKTAKKLSKSNYTCLRITKVHLTFQRA